MRSDFDAYRILEIDTSAGSLQVEDAYRRLLDRHSGDEDRLREVRAAYAILSHPDQRREYDERRAARLESAPGPYSADTPTGFEQTISVARKAPWGPGDIAKAVGLTLLGLLVFMVPLALLAAVIAGDESIEDHETALTILVASSVVLQILLGGTAWLFAVRKYRVPWSRLGIRWPQRGGFWLPFALLIASYITVISYFVFLQEVLGIEPDTDLPEQIFENTSTLIALAVLSLLFAPVMEEIFFRGFVFGGLRSRWGLVPAALASALLFGIAHIGNPGAFYVAVPIAAVGLIFLWGYIYSGSIIPTMFAHFLFNLGSLTISIIEA